MPHDSFAAAVADFARAFSAVDRQHTIRVISHLDCDGICASSILVRALGRQGRRYSISVFQQLNARSLLELAGEEYQFYVFADLGSSSLSAIKKTLRDKTVFVIDHHPPEDISLPDGFFHLNPHLFRIDGSREISGSGVVYLFAKALDPANVDSAHIAVIGAIGDVQEQGGFGRLNSEILQEAIGTGKIGVEPGLRFFGKNSRPLHKLFEYSTDPFIPGITGSESSAIQFLQQLGISPKNGSQWRKFSELSDDERKRLTAAIIMRRVNEPNPNDIFENSYFLRDEQKGSHFFYAKEFSTILNSCGRLEKASVGIGVCLGSEDARRKALQLREVYKREIVNAMSWFERSRGSPNVISGDGFVVINAQDHILPSMIGTFASILAKSGSLRERTYILGLAQAADGTSKLSLRISGSANGNAGLNSIMEKIISRVGGEAGGHCNAAGGVIPTEKEEEFIRVAEQVLAAKAMEEKVA